MPQSFDKYIRYKIDSPETVDAAALVPLDYQYQDRRGIEIIIEQTEFTSVCPMTGLPDFGYIKITYHPDQKIVELKSLKFYLLQYRNVGIFYEHVVNRILEDLVQLLEPIRMEVIGEFTERGGIKTKVKAVHEGKNDI
ncbi:MAG: NADPH-dependent 7-cyano-7-deazaguanine reductase QueF [Deltaproteobacteria bacterium]|nr:NADPH-dependent 7-cyano-7-deazaguanine reductase QueF [Deltaproteobacteria bacterium]